MYPAIAYSNTRRITNIFKANFRLIKFYLSARICIAHFKLVLPATMASSPKGIRLLKAIEHIKKKPSFDAVCVLKKMQLESASDGVLKGSFKIEPTMCNLGGTVHGGYLASVADVFSFYSHFCSPDAKASWTTSMNIMYLGPAKEGETVNVETKPVKSGNISVIETYFFGQQGSLIAKGTATFTVGKEKYQHLFKELTNFDVNEN